MPRIRRLERNTAAGLRELMLDGGLLRIRPARPSDAAAVAAMRQRCSARRLASRRSLHTLTQPLCRPGRIALLAELNGSQVVGIAALSWLPSLQMAKVGLLVEDDWQGRGVGTALLAALATTAPDPTGRTQRKLPSRRRC